MFELNCFSCEAISLKDGKKFYRIWFTLPNGKISWLTSNKSFVPGEAVPIQVDASFTNDTKTNMRMTVRIV